MPRKPFLSGVWVVVLTEQSKDFVRPFLLRRSGVRGRVAHLNETVNDVLSRQDYPEAVARLVGEALLVCALVASGFKLRHRFSLQIKTDGEVRLIMAEYTTDGTMRAYASFDDAARLIPMEQAHNLLGRGTMAMIIDHGPGTEPYQGIVPLSGGDIAESVQEYFGQSDQIPTSIRVAMAQQIEPDNSYMASGILVQHLPGEGGHDGHDEDDFVAADAIMHTIHDSELCDVGFDANGLLYKLFHEHEVAVLDDAPVCFGCSCSHQRIADAIRLYDKEGIAELEDAQMVDASCQFCGHVYEFSGGELKAE